MQIKDLVFIASMATLMAVITDILYPIAVLLGGPLLGPSLVHHALFAIPLSLILNIIYYKRPKFGTYTVFSLIWGFLMFIRLGIPIPILGFFSAGLISEIFASVFRFFRLSKKILFLNIQSGIFVFSLGLLMSVLFAFFVGSVGQKLILHHMDLLYIIVLIPALITIIGGYLTYPIIIELKIIGALSE